ncbi:lipocalin family protein [Polaromonas sp.]|jgi:apolipoprotein D and lipocalin family protein|uniref:lipocalin family protein n=1 Tax=Polaromonas sp. TaxID=1869339 RepID=UPI0025CBB8AB|nr:lipocalin family protein [Polaromonas sp.]
MNFEQEKSCRMGEKMARIHGIPFDGTEMKTLISAAILVLSGTFAHAADNSPPVPPLTAISALDVSRYMGTWYEIAKFPAWFQKKCVADTRAEYSLLPGGKVQVINLCSQENGEMKEAVGSARQIGEKTSSMLEVRFAPAWLSFIPAIWGDYWVIDLDPDYQLVAVSEPKREYLWILSRTRKVDSAAYDALLGRLTRKGFDLQRLEKTPHRE